MVSMNEETQRMRRNAVGPLRWFVILAVLAAGFVAYSFAHDPDRHPLPAYTWTPPVASPESAAFVCFEAGGQWDDFFGVCRGL